MSDDAAAGDALAGVLEALAAASADARHPGLRLSCFVAEPPDGDVLDDPGTLDDLAETVPAHIRRHAEMRRGALIVAAMQVIEQCLDDLQELTFDEEGMPDPERAAESVVFEAFPPRHRSAYTRRFFRDVLVVAVKVGSDLADPNGGPAACTAEEILRSHFSSQAVALCERAGLGAPWFEPDEILLEDGDFETLYDDAMDGIEDDPAYQAAISLEIAPVTEWFTPFNRHRIVHPYVRTEPSPAGQLHDLRQRLGELTREQAEALDWTRVDDPAPLGGLNPISEVVALARAVARDEAAEDTWVADPEQAEDSFGDLVRATTLSASGSGWMTWEPHQGADTVRTAAVITAAAHRHFPVGTDEPYLDVSLGGTLLSVPVSAVVSYRPDPEPRRRWQEAFAKFAPAAGSAS